MAWFERFRISEFGFIVSFACDATVARLVQSSRYLHKGFTECASGIGLHSQPVHYMAVCVKKLRVDDAQPFVSTFYEDATTGGHHWSSNRRTGTCLVGR